LFIFSVIIGLLVFFIIRGNSLKIGNVEIGSKPNSTDTLIQVKPETIVVEKPVILPSNSSIKKMEKTSVKSGDTSILVNNQPANINTGSNSGIIGNNNTINVGQEKKIELKADDKKNLIVLLNKELEKLPKEKNKRVEVTAILGNERSTELAQLIFEYLKNEKYNVNVGINHAVFINAPKGVEIGIKEDYVEIIVFNV
jgi:predicted AlkP superfamily phosphohydrolase/phosphomutase